MDSRRVLTFRAVAHARSFSRAARELALTQPSVSQQVAALERELGTRLLHRERGGLRLTEAGAVLLGHADVVAERLSLADVQLSELARAERVRLRIGAFSSAIAGLVPDVVARLHERSPALEIMIVEGDAADLADQIRRGALHVAIAFQDAALPERALHGAERRNVMREEFLIALAPGHPLAGREALRLEALADEPWIASTPDGLIVQACRRAGFEPRLVSLTRDPLAIRELVLRGVAVTLAPRRLTGGFADVALRPIAGDGPQRDIFVILPAGGRHRMVEEAVAALIAVIAEVERG
jgi:DNA-binding transcriptional LysR family regulator